MPAGIIVDTSYLITLADQQRANHDAALRYWQHVTEEAIPIFLPTIVVSEFCVRQPIPPELLRSCVLLPFNWDDAQKAAELQRPTFDREGESRAALKDDIKIIAQAVVKDAAWIITDDTRLFYRFAESLRDEGTASFRPIKLEDGFDRAFFDSAGQRDFHDTLEDSSEDDTD